MYDNLISDLDLHYFDASKTPGKKVVMLIRILPRLDDYKVLPM